MARVRSYGDSARAYQQLERTFKQVDYARLMASRPLYGIADSPVGLAAWLLDNAFANVSRVPEHPLSMLVGPDPHSLSLAHPRSLGPQALSPSPEPPGLELSSWRMVSFRSHGLGTLWVVGILLGLVVRGHGSVQTTPPAQLSAEDAKAKETFHRVCVKCHPVERVTAEGRSRSQWENTIVAMQTTRGAVVTPEEFDIVLDYLSKFHGRDTAAVAPAPGGPGPGGRGPRANVGAADRHRVDPAAVVRGQKIYASECVTCHGASARGTERGANLIRSPRVLRDRYGSAIGPYLKGGHPTQTGSAASLTEAQVADISHFIWDRINNTLRGSPEFDVKNVLTGDPAAGQVYFNGSGGCAACHSPTGDLAGYGKRYAPVDIQQRFVFPAAGGGRGRGGTRRQVTVTVTVPNAVPITGTLVSIDDFHVALREKNGAYRSWSRTADMTIVKNDPFAAHVELLDRLTDKAMHDVVAYLETLK